MNKNVKKPETKPTTGPKKDEKVRSKTKDDSKGKKPAVDKKPDAKKHVETKKAEKKADKADKKPRGISGYILFGKENREKIKKENQGAANKEIMGVRISNNFKFSLDYCQIVG